MTSTSLKQRVTTRILRQFGRPHGVPGRLVGWVMAHPVNSLGFWPNPTQQLSELRGLLRPGGRIALASQPRCAGATADTTARAGRELHDRLTQAGFTQARMETLPLAPPVACVLATNPAEEQP
ncbi:hypothetical protein ACH4S9_16905 [Streptomyces sp. NPDC021225]|uniref:hypothetical protein n=1 Tax=Streptomyces sp. NPDC021225 TaxID=3365121 RepID=UPI00379AEFAE